MDGSDDIRELLVTGLQPRLDLGTDDVHDASALREAIGAAGDRPVVTAFGAIAATPAYAELVETLVAVAGETGATVVFDVPDHDVTGEDAGDGPVLTAGAVAELERLLPRDHVVLHEVPLRGAALVASTSSDTHTLEVPVTPAAPQRYVLAFGPRVGELAGVATVAQADARGELARIRALEADAALVTTLLTERRA